jgi:Protein of unknown function (DUF5131)
MAQNSNIEWTDDTWNPIVGCQIVSPGCTNCYAMKMAARTEAMTAANAKPSPYAGTTMPSKAGGTRVIEIAPDTEMDFRNLPFWDDSFKLVVFDRRTWCALVQSLGLPQNTESCLKIGNKTWRQDLQSAFVFLIRAVC